MHKYQRDLFSLNNFLLLLIWTEENKDVIYPKKSKPNTTARKTSLLHFILDNQAVLLKCDHGLGLNLAHSNYSDSQFSKEIENFHSN